jgi:hypothetical protein
VDPKLTMLFLLIGIIIGLSHLSSKNQTKSKRELGGRGWRAFLPRWREF